MRCVITAALIAAALAVAGCGGQKVERTGAHLDVYTSCKRLAEKGTPTHDIGIYYATYAVANHYTQARTDALMEDCVAGTHDGGE